GNALSEVFVMGDIAGRGAASRAAEVGPSELPRKEVEAEKERLESFASGGDRPLRAMRRSVKELMWYKAGIARNGKELENALGQIEEFHRCVPDVQVEDFRDLMKALELQNMLISAEMVCRAALARTESRGAHYRDDYPDENNNDWLKNIVIRKQDSGMGLQEVPVTMDIMTFAIAFEQSRTKGT
ncbi:MAG: hypothetical protein JW821_03650, partial [Deltaproteobacteria bacterium]|nr:hypothetical protein [Deltaproteobacteria bacterium]